MRISKFEKWMIVVISVLLWTVLALLAGGPIFSDEMLYLDAGLRNVAVPSYGNRYFHIYLQKLFVSIFPTPLTGVRVFHFPHNRTCVYQRKNIQPEKYGFTRPTGNYVLIFVPIDRRILRRTCC